MLGTSEIIVIILAVLILFGGKKMPDIARNLGKSINALKQELRDVKKSLEETEQKDDNPELKG